MATCLSGAKTTGIVIMRAPPQTEAPGYLTIARLLAYIAAALGTSIRGIGRSAYRYYFEPDDRNAYVGFRVVCRPPGLFSRPPASPCPLHFYTFALKKEKFGLFV
jgi:hypothetical protein